MDASDHSRLAEAKEAFNGIIGHHRMCGKPLLIFANKQDLVGTLSNEQVGQLLVEGLPEEPGTPTEVVSYH